MSQDQEQWDKVAEQYHQLVGSTQDRLRTALLYPHLLELLGDIHDQRVLDIGCGNGLFAHLLTQKHAKVTAFDSEKMIQTAQHAYPSTHIHYQVHDGTKAFPYLKDTFDLATANLVLMDIEDITQLVAESHRILKQNGRFFVSILHPCFTPPVGRFRRGILGRINKNWAYFHLKNYFAPPNPTTKKLFGKYGPSTPYYHRTIGEYAHLFSQHKFMIKNISEPQANNLLIQESPHLFHAQKIAIFLVFELHKTS